jgi:hypothetical protein
MNIPGFTAEGALNRNYQQYPTSMVNSGSPPSTDSQVTPQLRPLCFVRSFGRTFSRCLGLGYSAGACDQVAWDLAMSVCSD